jgi:hypothetical protein
VTAITALVDRRGAQASCGQLQPRLGQLIDQGFEFPTSGHEDPTPFSDSQRVVYTKNPLEVVICQLRFPAILKISSEPPVDFQEALRKNYPLFREVPPLDVGTGLPPELSVIMGKLMPFPSSKAYELTSENGAWQITLTQESLALQCKAYRRWEEFRDALQTALVLLRQIYELVIFYSRRVAIPGRDCETPSRPDGCTLARAVVMAYWRPIKSVISP